MSYFSVGPVGDASTGFTLDLGAPPALNASVSGRWIAEVPLDRALRLTGWAPVRILPERRDAIPPSALHLALDLLWWRRGGFRPAPAASGLASSASITTRRDTRAAACPQAYREEDAAAGHERTHETVLYRQGIQLPPTHRGRLTGQSAFWPQLRSGLAWPAH